LDWHQIEGRQEDGRRRGAEKEKEEEESKLIHY
jgi:hypothetical protein